MPRLLVVECGCQGVSAVAWWDAGVGVGRGAWRRGGFGRELIASSQQAMLSAASPPRCADPTNRPSTQAIGHQ